MPISQLYPRKIMRNWMRQSSMAVRHEGYHIGYELAMKYIRN